MAKYKIVALPKDADDYLELDLTPEEIQEYAKGGYIIEDISIPSLSHMQEGGDPVKPDPKTSFYTVKGSNGVYRKVNGKWEVDWNRSGKFQPLSKGDVAKRTAVLNSQAKPLYDPIYDDLYTTSQSAYTAKPKPTTSKKLSTTDKKAQEAFEKSFKVLTGPESMAVDPYTYPAGTNAANSWESQKEQLQPAYDNVNNWYNNWYMGRAQLPEFRDVAMQRLHAINPTVTVQPSHIFKEEHPGSVFAVTYKPETSEENKSKKNQIFIANAMYPDSGNNDYYNYMQGDPKHALDYFTNEYAHEKSHWYENNFPQEGTQPYSYTDEVPSTSQVFAKGKPTSQYLNIDASPEASVWTNDRFKGVPADQYEYLQRPTELRARLNVWRMQNNIDPTKKYTVDEIRKIMDENIKNFGDSHNNVRELYKLINNDPKALKELNDRYVSNDSNKNVDMAQYGGIRKFPDGGLVQLDRAPGARFKKNASGTWVYESGAPITDQFILQELNYGKGKPVGSPVVYGPPKPKLNIAREEELKVIKNSPRIEDQKKATQIKAELEEERRRAEAAFQAKLYNDMHYEQPLDMMDWTWQAAAGLPVLAAEAPAIWGLAEGALSTPLPGMASIPGATFGNALGSAFAVTSGKNLLEVPSQIQKGEYADAAANVLTGALDIGAAGIVSPIYKGTKSALSELGKFVGTEEGLLSNTYKLNPWANKTYTFPKPQVGELINNPFRNEITPIENLSNKIDYFHLKADPKNMPYAAARDTDFWHQLNSDPRFVIKGTDTKPNAVIDFPVPFGSDLIDARKLPIPISELDQFRIKPKPNWLKGYPTELPGSPNNSFSIFPKDPVPLPGSDLWFAQASKTVGADQIPENQWFNQKNKELSEKLEQEIAQQKAASEELSGFGGKEALDKIDKSKVSNEAFKRLIMGDDLKFKMDDYPDTPRVPFTKKELGREGNKFFPKVEYQPMDAATREEINVLNNIERSTNRLPEAYQALLDIQALRTEMDARDFVRQFRYELKNPRTGKPYSLTEIKIASPNQIKTWRNEIERSLIKPILTEMDLQNAQPKVNARDFKFYSNKEGGSINSKLSKFIS